MPSETRLIKFSNAELIEAIHRARKMVNPPLPVGTIDSCRTAGQKDASVTIAIKNKSDGSSQEAKLNPATIAAVLLQYCFFRRIPIPRSATKSVEADNGSVTLVLQTGQRADLEAVTPQEE